MDHFDAVNSRPKTKSEMDGLEAMLSSMTTLPNDVSTKPPTAKPTTSTSYSDPSAPQNIGAALPPGHQVTAGLTVDEVLVELNKSPLFMTDLVENDDVAALQALAYEGTPVENAADFKERGNESFRERRWGDAREFYTKGVVILVAEERKRVERRLLEGKGMGLEVKGKEVVKGGEVAGDGEEEKVSDPAEEAKVLESLYVNRAAAQLELRNYRSAKLDCDAALYLNPGNVKALYRQARALAATGKHAEAIEACDRGLGIDAANASLKKLRAEVTAQVAAAAAKEKKERDRIDTTARREKLVRVALAARNIRTRTTDKPPDMDGVTVRLEPDADDPKSGLVFPAVLLYPCHLQSDLIRGWGEQESVGAHLEYILPVPWDTEGEYTAAGVECFMETVSGGLVKVGKKMALLEVLGGGKVEVVDGIVRVFVVPKGRSKAWVEEFKMKRAAEAGK